MILLEDMTDDSSIREKAVQSLIVTEESLCDRTEDLVLYMYDVLTETVTAQSTFKPEAFTFFRDHYLAIMSSLFDLNCQLRDRKTQIDFDITVSDIVKLTINFKYYLESFEAAVFLFIYMLEISFSE